MARFEAKGGLLGSPRGVDPISYLSPRTVICLVGNITRALVSLVDPGWLVWVDKLPHRGLAGNPGGLGSVPAVNHRCQSDSIP